VKSNIKIPNVTKTTTYGATTLHGLANPVFRISEIASRAVESNRSPAVLNEALICYQVEHSPVIGASASGSKSKGDLHANADPAVLISDDFDTTRKQFGYIQ
jgi:hypothetical protein